MIKLSDLARLQHRPVPQGAGGLKCVSPAPVAPLSRPVPQGAGGLKWNYQPKDEHTAVSRPARGGWIEIHLLMAAGLRAECPVPQGAGGLKWL